VHLVEDVLPREALLDQEVVQLLPGLLEVPVQGQLYLLLKDASMLLPDYIYVLSAVFAIESGLGVFLAGRRLSTKYTVLKLYQEV
jgi:hypothetical protein